MGEDESPTGRMCPARFVPRPPQRHGRETASRSCPAAVAHADQRPALSGGPARGRSTSNRGAPAASIRFPPSNFKHSLTLFSKSFSSFPRGTCSLSVSCQYLALEGIYLPLRAAFPNSPTRRPHLVEQHGPGSTGLSPSPTSLSRELGPGALQRMRLQTTSCAAQRRNFQAGLFPVRSPLLGKSWLVSSPALSDMLKLGAWSFLIRGLGRDGGIFPPRNPVTAAFGAAVSGGARARGPGGRGEGIYPPKNTVSPAFWAPVPDGAPRVGLNLRMAEYSLRKFRYLRLLGPKCR